jgi:hypothetical protein
MNYDVEMGSGAMIYVPSFIKIDSAIQQLIRGESQTQTEWRSHTPLWSSGQSFWLQIQRSWVRFQAFPDFLRSSGSGTGSSQPREDN